MMVAQDTTQMLVLVDENDQPLGTMEKMEAHRKALLHRAFSVFLFNSKGEMLLQRRALKKYHSGGLWTNTCCSHPYPGESPQEAGVRRTKEEMGIDIEVEPAFSFIYKAALDNELTEYEFDHVLIGQYDGEVYPNEDEVGDYCYKTMDDIRAGMASHPGKYTAWFKIAFPMLEEHLQAHKKTADAV
jgi:isopentenyl-diphosphate delta-isomerase